MGKTPGKVLVMSQLGRSLDSSSLQSHTGSTFVGGEWGRQRCEEGWEVLINSF